VIAQVDSQLPLGLERLLLPDAEGGVPVGWSANRTVPPISSNLRFAGQPTAILNPVRSRLTSVLNFGFHGGYTTNSGSVVG
jgi:hypothetical protein